MKVVGDNIVRAKNDTSSDRVGYITVETILNYSNVVGGWYYVELPDGKHGYIYGSRCTEVK